jgi:1-deoxy-D-xylulose-5-phosphate synthase
LLTGFPFGFMALLGVLALGGELIKSQIVVLSKILSEIHDGKAPYQAIIDGGTSKMRPVCMVVVTTVLGMIPGMVILAPSDEKELRNLLHTALQYSNGPIAVRYPRGNAIESDAKLPFETLPIGLPKVVEEGEDLLILAVGHMLGYARKAAAALRAEGFKPTLVDARTVKPLNREAYDALFDRHRAVLTVEDNVLHGGYGTTVSLLLNDLGRRDLPLGHVALPDAFVTHGEVPVLHRIHGMDADGIHNKALELLNQNKFLNQNTVAGRAI